MPAERLQKLLARAGHGSRRSAERLIVEGRVTVDGRVASLGERADPTTSTVAVDGQPLATERAPVTLMLNKPEGYVVTAADEQGRPTVYDLLPDAPPGLRYVGRLDLNSGGLLLLTTDGELAFRLSHPRYEVAKRYEAVVDAVPSEAMLARLRAGVELEDGRTAPAEVTLLGGGPDGSTRLQIAIHEGRKRQVRRMLRAVGHSVLRLTRTAVDGLDLGDLAPGECRPLTADEEQALRHAVGLGGGPVDARNASSL